MPISVVLHDLGMFVICLLRTNINLYIIKYKCIGPPTVENKRALAASGAAARRISLKHLCC